MYVCMYVSEKVLTFPCSGTRKDFKKNCTFKVTGRFHIVL